MAVYNCYIIDLSPVMSDFTASGQRLWTRPGRGWPLDGLVFQDHIAHEKVRVYLLTCFGARHAGEDEDRVHAQNLQGFERKTRRSGGFIDYVDRAYLLRHLFHCVCFGTNILR